MRLFLSARRVAATACLAPALAGCSGGAGDGDAATPDSPAPSGLEQAWSELFEEANRELRGEGYSWKQGDQRCFEGEHGARLSARYAGAERIRYLLTRDSCDAGTAEVRLEWSVEQLRVVDGEDRAMAVPAVRSALLQDRQGTVWVAMDSLVAVAEEIRGDGGRYPAEYGPAFEERHYLTERLIDSVVFEYRAAEDRRSYRACVQYGADGPWRSYDSEAGGPINQGESGECSYEPPAAGSVTEVLLDAERVAYGALADGSCERLPAAEALVAAGQLSEGNRVAECEPLTDMEGLPAGTVVCVQHGHDGAWAVRHDWNGTKTGESGACDLAVPEPVLGPFA